MNYDTQKQNLRFDSSSWLVRLFIVDSDCKMELLLWTS